MTVTYYSQIGQDRILDEEIFRGQRGGVFVDIGAYDGSKYSNTRFFEEQRGWTGVCIEPLPDAFEQLQKNRRCACMRACIGARDGECKFLHVQSPQVDTAMLSGVVDQYDARHLDRVRGEVVRFGGSLTEIAVTMRTLQSVLKELKIKNVSFISLDTEGSELAILRSFDPGSFGVRCLLVENNYADQQIEAVLRDRGYQLFRTLHGYEQIFVSKRH